MGILNITPDSFSGDGLLSDQKAANQSVLEIALEQARQFVAAGADILDVGGESTRPGAQPVSEAEEMARVLPIVEALVKQFEVLVSVDTYRASVAQAALELGAHMINDVWGLRADPRLAQVIADHMRQ
jgi:dihydropteroate synthase